MSDSDTPIAERTYRELREAVLRGRYLPGERLTSVRLAEDFGVSRTPVRAALMRLKADGLVDFTDGRAAWIPPLTVEAVEEAYEIYGALEAILVTKLARAATKEQLRDLRATVVTMERAAKTGDKQRWAEGDQQFHDLLHDYVGSDLVKSMLARVSTVVDRVRFLSLNLHPESASTSAKEHRAVFNAIREHDGDRAKQLHEAHFSRVREQNVEFLRESFTAFGSLPVQPAAPMRTGR